jgi:hypothetical protein
MNGLNQDSGRNLLQQEQRLDLDGSLHDASHKQLHELHAVVKDLVAKIQEYFPKDYKVKWVDSKGKVRRSEPMRDFGSIEYLIGIYCKNMADYEFVAGRLERLLLDAEHGRSVSSIRLLLTPRLGRAALT